MRILKVTSFKLLFTSIASYFFIFTMSLCFAEKEYSLAVLSIIMYIICSIIQSKERENIYNNNNNINIKDQMIIPLVDLTESKYITADSIRRINDSEDYKNILRHGKVMLIYNAQSRDIDEIFKHCVGTIYGFEIVGNELFARIVLINKDAKEIFESPYKVALNLIVTNDTKELVGISFVNIVTSQGENDG